MVAKKSMWVLLSILVISAWVLESAIQVGAETLNYKTYTYVTKAESIPVGDVDGHTMNLYIRRAFIVFENGEVATQISVITSDWIKGSGPGLQYNTMTFSDGSTIIMKVQTTRTPTSSKLTREIIKGTGRFEGIRGTGTGVTKFFPVEEGEAGPKGVGEGSITYTLPPK